MVQGCALKVHLGIVHSLLEEGDELGHLVASVEEAMEEELEFLHDIFCIQAELMDAEDAKLKTDLEDLALPANASLFTYDAVAMYPSINTTDCLARLSGYLSKEEVSGKYGFSSAALLEAIEIMMFSNRMRFGDIIVKQLSGIAMGMSPAPTIANICGNL